MKYLCFIIIAVMAGCNNENTRFDVVITENYILDSISSGSAIAVEGDSAFIVGDDVNYLSVLDIKDRSTRKIMFNPTASSERMPKALKHDFESCVTGQINNRNYLMAFGSGGISPMRDSVFVFEPDSGKNFTSSLDLFYKAVAEKARLKTGELNFEGAALSGNRLMLFNRGKNFICIIEWDQMADYICRRKTVIPSFKIIPLTLPVVNGFQVGFSGACMLDEHQVLFTASLEETKYFIDDGAVKGSYIGVLDLHNETATITQFTQLRDERNSIVLDKLESVDIIRPTDSSITAIAVADNDNGTSKIFMLEISR